MIRSDSFTGGKGVSLPAAMLAALALLAGCTDGNDFYGPGDPPPSLRSFSYNDGIAGTARIHAELQAQPGLGLIGAHHAYGWSVTGSGRQVIRPEGRVKVGIGGLGLDHNHPKIRANLLLVEDDPERIEPPNGYFLTDAELATIKRQRELMIRGLTATYFEREERAVDGDSSVTEGIGDYPGMANVHADYIVHIDDIDLLYTPLPPEEDEAEEAAEDADDNDTRREPPVVFSYIDRQCSNAADYASAPGGNCPVATKQVHNPYYDPDGSEDPAVNPEMVTVSLRHFVDFGDGTEEGRDLRVIPGSEQLKDGSQSAGIIANERNPELLGTNATHEEVVKAREAVREARANAQFTQEQLTTALNEIYQNLSETLRDELETNVRERGGPQSDLVLAGRLTPELAEALINEPDAFHGVAFGALLVPHITTANLNVSCRNTTNEEFEACLRDGDTAVPRSGYEEDGDILSRRDGQLDPDYDKDLWLAEYIRAIPGADSARVEDNAVDIFLLDVAWQGNGVVLDDEATAVDEHQAYRAWLEGDPDAGVKYNEQLGEYRRIVREYEDDWNEFQATETDPADPATTPSTLPQEPTAPTFDPEDPNYYTQTLPNYLRELETWRDRLNQLGLPNRNGAPVAFDNYPDYVTFRANNPGFDPLNPPDTVGRINDTLDALHDFFRRRDNLRARRDLVYDNPPSYSFNHPIMVVRSAYKGFQAAPATSVQSLNELTASPDLRGGPRTLAALPYYYELGCGDGEDENDVNCKDFRGNLVTAVALGEDMTPEPTEKEPDPDTTYFLDPRSPRCGPLPADWSNDTNPDNNIRDQRDGKHYCLTAPGAGTRINGMSDTANQLVLSMGYRTLDVDDPDYQPDLYAAAYLAGSLALLHERFRNELSGDSIVRRLLQTADNGRNFGTEDDPEDANGYALTEVFEAYRNTIYDSPRGYEMFDFDCGVQAGAGEDDRCIKLREDSTNQAIQDNVYPSAEDLQRTQRDPTEDEVEALQEILDAHIHAIVEDETQDAIDAEMLDTFGAGFIDLEAAMQPLGVPRILTVFVQSASASASTVSLSAASALASTSLATSAAFGDGIALSLAGEEIAAFDELGAPFWHPLSGLISTRTSSRETLAERYADLAYGEADRIPLAGGGMLSLTSWRANGLFADGRGTERLRAGYETLNLDEERRISLSLRQPVGGVKGNVELLFATGDLASLPLGPHGQPDVDHPYLGFADEGVGIGGSVPAGAGRLTALGFSSAGDLSASAISSTSDTEAPREIHGGLLQYAFSPFADAHIAIETGALVEENRFLGLRGTGAFSGLGAATTGFAGLSVDSALAAGWRLRADMHGGMTRTSAPSNSLIADWSTTATSAFSLGLAGSDLLRPQDSFSLSLAQPLRVESGEATLLVPTGRASSETILPRYALVDGVGLAPSGRQLELSAVYRLQLPEETVLSLGAGVVQDGGHVAAAEPEAYILGDLRFRF